MRTAAALFIAFFASVATAQPRVQTVRVPDAGLQPQCALDQHGIVHLIYLTGDAQAADITYVRTTDNKLSFSEPIRVNTTPGSALAIGTIRGPHLSLGHNGIVHVAWMGSGKSQPKAPGKQAPMLYTRLLPGKQKFEPERNLITKYVGLDGGGTVAADPNGNVYVAWHAPSVPKGDESTRRVFVARSTDDGATFAPEEPINDDNLGACGCCGMELLASPGGAVIGLFRTATEQVHRDTRAFLFQGTLERHWGGTLDPAKTGTCQMSTYALADILPEHRFVAAWETLGKIRFGVYSYRSTTSDHPHDVPGAERKSKHPAVAVDAKGNILIAWAEGTGWEKGGAVAWQMFDRELHPVPDAHGRADGLPAWSRPAVAALRDDDAGFVVIY